MNVDETYLLFIYLFIRKFYKNIKNQDYILYPSLGLKRNVEYSASLVHIREQCGATHSTIEQLFLTEVYQAVLGTYNSGRVYLI